MSETCEYPLDKLTVQVWLLYMHVNLKYCTFNVLKARSSARYFDFLQLFHFFIHFYTINFILYMGRYCMFSGKNNTYMTLFSPTNTQYTFFLLIVPRVFRPWTFKLLILIILLLNKTQYKPLFVTIFYNVNAI